MKIGYGKLGRSMPLTLAKCGNLGGDVEMVAVVKQLAERHPDDQFHLLGRNSGEHPSKVGLPSNVHNPWITWAPLLRNALNAAGLNHPNLAIEEHLIVRDIFDELTRHAFVDMDAHLWWVGQHGTSNSPIPKVEDPTVLTKPHDWSSYYGGYVLRGINAWRAADPAAGGPVFREEVWLNADPRNRHKMRDLKYPLQHPILTQYNFSHPLKHEQYDGSVPVTANVNNVYARLEVNGLAPGTPFGSLLSFDDNWAGRRPFGLFINEARRDVVEMRARRTVMKNWVLPLNPAFIHGTWSPASKAELDINPEPAPWDKYVSTLQSVRSTFTTPSSGSGWATAKPWEAFAAGTVCFFHPAYDTQDNILSDVPWLRDWLRVGSPNDLRYRIERVDKDQSLWHELITAQRAVFDAEMANPRWLNMVEERIWK